jgi:hypothetical protein
MAEESESLDDMMNRVGREFLRRADAMGVKADNELGAGDVRGSERTMARALKWTEYGHLASDKKLFPICGSDPELSLIFGKERAMAIRAKATLPVDSRAAADVPADWQTK